VAEIVKHKGLQMNATTKLIALALALTLFACASPPKVRVDKDSSTDFAAYKNFAWLGAQVPPPPVPGQPAGPAPLELNSITENRMRAAVLTALQAKGYALNEASPDFRVSYVFNAYARKKDSGMRIGLGAGGGGGHMAGGVGLSIPVGKTQETMGAMTIDIIDAARNAQVWTGTYEQKVKEAGMSDEEATKLVATILSRFPVDASKKK
jgi:Domain of unknown function (DUF4136)